MLSRPRSAAEGRLREAGEEERARWELCENARLRCEDAAVKVGFSQRRNFYLFVDELGGCSRRSRHDPGRTVLSAHAEERACPSSGLTDAPLTVDESMWR